MPFPHPCLRRLVIGYLTLGVVMGALTAGSQALGAPAPAAPSLTIAEITPVPVAENLVTNGSFETLSDMVKDWFQAWRWEGLGTSSTVDLDYDTVHSGQLSLRIANRTPDATRFTIVYIKERVKLQAGKIYTLSAYVRSAAPAGCWLGIGAGNRFRTHVPATGSEWRRVSQTFAPEPEDLETTPVIAVGGGTSALWVDDVRLEESTEPGFNVPQAAILTVAPGTPTAASDEPGTFRSDWELHVPPKTQSVRLSACIDGSPIVVRSLESAAGAYRVVLRGTRTRAVGGLSRISVTATAGDAMATGEQIVREAPRHEAERRLSRLRERIARLTQTPAAAPRPAAQTVSVAVVQRFLPFVADDLQHQDFDRARAQLDRLEEIADRAEAAAWPRPANTGSVLPMSKAGSPKPESRPFRIGYGHFAQVRADLEKLPALGANQIQVEVGPADLFPTAKTTHLQPIEDLKALLRRAERAGVAVDLLISPHYMPDWMFEQHPELRWPREGFIQYCIHAPAGREFLRHYLQVLLPPLRGHPALRSICLSNEPMNVEAPCRPATAAWHAWLAKRHGTIAALNQRWGSSFDAFSDVLLPNPYPIDQARLPAPQWSDFVRFNAEQFTDWHRMLAQSVHTLTPGVPVHAKVMAWSFLNSSEVYFGVDPTLMAEVTDLSGHDAHCISSTTAEWAADWQQSLMACDLQRSLKNAPVFDSEFHLLPDRTLEAVSPAHLRSALWQAAVRGQDAATIWAWERTRDPKSPFAGGILHRPELVEAVGQTSQQLAAATTAARQLQQAPPQVLLLHSTSSRVWEGDRTVDCEREAYTALSFAGYKVGFVTETQLERGVPTPRLPLLVPHVGYLSTAALEALRQYRGPIIGLGNASLLQEDEYGHPHARRLPVQVVPFVSGATTWRKLLTVLPPLLRTHGAHPQLSVAGRDGMAPAGVTWLTAQTNAGVLLAVCNYRREAVELEVRRAGEPVSGQDVLSRARVTSRVRLDPLEFRLLRWR